MRLRKANDCGVEEDCTNLERVTRVGASRWMGSATLAIELSVPEGSYIIKNYLYEILVSVDKPFSRPPHGYFFDGRCGCLGRLSTIAVWISRAACIPRRSEPA